MSRGSVESRMSDGMELACSNVGQDRQQQRCDDVNCWIGTDDEQKIRENGLDEFGQGSDDDGVVEFPDREKDWNNVDADKSSNATNQGKQSDDEAEFEEPRKNGEGVEKVREIGDAFDFCDPDRGVLDQRQIHGGGAGGGAIGSSVFGDASMRFGGVFCSPPFAGGTPIECVGVGFFVVKAPGAGGVECHHGFLSCLLRLSL